MPSSSDKREEENVSSFIKQYNLPERITRIIVDAPNSEPMKPGEEKTYDEGCFYIRLENLGLKHYLPKSKSKDFAEWCRLTVKLFL